MKDIVKIIIKSSSGYCNIDEAYKDKLVVTHDKLSYEYTPLVESKDNQTSKWTYKTNSLVFQNLFMELSNKTLPIIFSAKKIECEDTGEVEFIIIYSDKTKQSKSYWCSADYFADYFSVIRKMITDCITLPKSIRAC